jgi:hypothetical protein
MNELNTNLSETRAEVSTKSSAIQQLQEECSNLQEQLAHQVGTAAELQSQVIRQQQLGLIDLVGGRQR